MIAQHLASLQSGEHIRGVVYLGNGPLVNAGGAPVPQESRCIEIYNVGIGPFPWVVPTLVHGYSLKTDTGRPFILCSLLDADSSIRQIASRIKERSVERLWRLALDGIKHDLEKPTYDTGLKENHNIRHYGLPKSGGAESPRIFLGDLGRFMGRNVFALLAMCVQKKMSEKSSLRWAPALFNTCTSNPCLLLCGYCPKGGLQSDQSDNI